MSLATYSSQTSGSATAWTVTLGNDFANRVEGVVYSISFGCPSVSTNTAVQIAMSVGGAFNFYPVYNGTLAANQAISFHVDFPQGRRLWNGAASSAVVQVTVTGGVNVTGTLTVDYSFAKRLG